MPRSSPQKRRAAHQARLAAQQAERRGSRRATAPRIPLDLSAARTVTTIPGIVILPLRIFLGITFIYAGWQKLTDPGFFTLGSNTYIGSQLRGFAHGSPINFILQHFLEHAVAIGWLTIFTEMLVGVLILLGLFTRPAALIGLMLSLTFFLSASWHVYPYFLGSDIVFVMCWLTLILAGPGAYYLDAVVAPRIENRLPRGLAPILLGRTVTEAPQPAEEGVPVVLHPKPETRTVVTRAEALTVGLVSVILVILGLSPKGSLISAAAPAPTTPAPAPQPTSPASATSPPAANPTPTAVAAGAQKVGNISQVPVNSALATTDPKSGDPAVVVHTAAGVVAYDAICTHAGCTVQYDPSYKYLICPCHGGAFDPAQNGAVVAGPPPAPLTPLPVSVDASGNILLT